MRQYNPLFLHSLSALLKHNVLTQPSPPTPPPFHPFTLLQPFWSLPGRTPPVSLTVLQGYLVCPFWLMQKIGLLYLNVYDNEPRACCYSPTRSRISRSFPLWAILATAFGLAPEQWRSHLWGLKLLSFGIAWCFSVSPLLWLGFEHY